ncbi:MAG: hypothetical protein Q8Q56_02525 [Alphaproteobacteria bacterium]|nr:hypothetical protein [Alphaproteobacteria bacterium]
MNRNRKFLLGTISLLAYHSLHAAALIPVPAFENEPTISKKAEKLGAFVGGIKEGMESRIKVFAASTESKEASDLALKGIKSGIDIAAAAATAGAAGATVGASHLTGQVLPKFSSPLFELGSLIASIIIAKREEVKAVKYARIASTLQTAAYTNPATIERLGSVVENIASTYADCITGCSPLGHPFVATEKDAFSIGNVAGQTIIAYILNPGTEDRELQSFDIWEKHLLSIVKWGVFDGAPPAHVAAVDHPRYQRYQALSQRILNDPLEPVVAVPAPVAPRPPIQTIRDELDNVLRVIPGSVTTPLIRYKAKRFLLATSVSKESSDLIIRDAIETALQNAGLVNPNAAVNAALAVPHATIKDVLEAILAPDASLTRRVYLQNLNEDDRVRFLCRMLEAPRAPELELLAYLLRKELVRSLDFHSLVKPSRWTPSILNASAIWGVGAGGPARQWDAPANVGVRYGRPATDAATYGTRKYYPHEGIYRGLLDDEIDLLNHQRYQRRDALRLTQYQ